MRLFQSSLVAVLSLVAVSTARPAFAQDPFEIQVYEWALVPRGVWNLETHMNYTTRASPTYNKNQSHLTFELTRGVSDYFELAGYLLTSRDANGHGDLVGWHVRPRFALPENAFPVKVSLSTEIGFPVDKSYEDADVTLEVRPIFEANVGRAQVDFNPVFGHVWGGPESGAWDFEPDARIAYPATPKIDISLEGYAAMNALGDSRRVYQIFPNLDIQLRQNVVWNVGVGFGLTDFGNQLVYKMRLGWMFGGH